MSNRLKVLLSAAVLGVGVFGGLAWYLGFFAEEPEAASVAEATAALSQDDAAGGSESSEVLTDLSGTWNVEPGEATYVGYRVNEVLSSVGDFTAVGRSSIVEGTLQAEGLTITAVSIESDLTGLTSNSKGRDGQLRKQALETNTFPQGLFVLTSPIVVDAIPVEGDVFATTATGDLTIHGETQAVQIEIEGTVQGSRLVIIGSMKIVMSDFGIEPPSAPLVASIEDEGIMELSLVFVRA